ncbi:MAG: LeuA family protein [Bacillota bacterium]
MSKTPWKTDRWFVSPFNYEPEVTKGLNFPKKIEFHDVTLRDGEQQAAVVFDVDDKLRIAERLAEAGIQRIEAGMPAVSPQDEKAIKEIVKRKFGPKVFSFARCVIDDVNRAADCGVDGVVVEIPSSDHLIQKAYQWPLEKAMDLSIRATARAHELGLYTVFFLIDESRANIDWVLDLVENVAKQGHMDALAIVDTFGGLSPHAVPWLVKKIRSRVKVPLEAHFHDDFGFGGANTIMALASGCEVAHTTVSNLGERAGNAAYEDVAAALLMMYGLDTGIKTEKMVDLSRMVLKMAGMNQRTNRGLIGDTVLNLESGIVSGWIRACGEKDMLEYVPYRGEMFGNAPPECVLGKHSGTESVKIWLEKLGRTATEEQVLEMVPLIKRRSYEKGGLLNEQDFRVIVDRVCGRAK